MIVRVVPEQCSRLVCTFFTREEIAETLAIAMEFGPFRKFSEVEYRREKVHAYHGNVGRRANGGDAGDADQGRHPHTAFVEPAFTSAER